MKQMKDLTKEQTDSFLIDVDIALSFAYHGLPWKIHLVCQDPRDNHDKFWTAEGVGREGEATVSWGRNGSAGTKKQFSIRETLEKAKEKRWRKGYREHPNTLPRSEAEIWLSMYKL